MAQGSSLKTIENRQREGKLLGELVSTTTQDGVRLDGFYIASQKRPTVSMDAVVLTHGLSGNFYGSRLLKHLADVFSDHGLAVILANTRGHDFLNLTVRSGRSQTIGAAYEVVSECQFDLFGWSQFLVDRGHNRILLAGHSLGAIKSLYAQAHLPHANVNAVAGLSATRLNYDSLLESPGGDRFIHWLKVTQDCVSEGRGDDLLHIDFPFPTWMSSNAYLAKYGAGDQYDWLTFAPSISVPTWVGFGQIELDENPAFAGLRPELKRVRRKLRNFSIETIENADHFYSACYPEASAAIMNWLETLS